MGVLRNREYDLHELQENSSERASVRSNPDSLILAKLLIIQTEYVIGTVLIINVWTSSTRESGKIAISERELRTQGLTPARNKAATISSRPLAEA